MSPAAPLVRVQSVTFDARDPHRVAAFWADLLGYVEDPDDPNLPEHTEVLIIDPARRQPDLLFIQVPDGKQVKNRVHLDLRPVERRDLTVERAVSLGGTVVDDRRHDDGSGWVVMADPEGNELCIVRSSAERGEVAPQHQQLRFPEGVGAVDERSMLTQLLDWYREGVVRKVRGLAPHLARAVPGPSATSVAGLVKHLALVEDSWFHERFAGHPPLPEWADVDWDADPDWEFHTALDDDLDDLIRGYEAACERSRAAASGHELDEVAADTRRRVFTLRFALVHLLEETARHLGQLDILREHLDGQRGE